MRKMNESIKNSFATIASIPAFIFTTLLMLVCYLFFPILAILGAYLNNMALLYIGGIISIIMSLYYYIKKIIISPIVGIVWIIMIISAMVKYTDELLNKFESCMFILAIAFCVIFVIDLIEETFKSAINHLKEKRYKANTNI